MTEPATIVVGVDGSEPAREALEYALDEAGRRGARLRVVRVLHPLEGWSVPHGLPAPPTPAEVTIEVEEALRRLVADVVATRPALGSVPVEVRALLGRPATVLVEQARRADLLVLGHRGRSGLASALLGSVCLECLLHAPCTVAVVRPVPVRVVESSGVG
jgi:nucleotide-binding universal stress UspA family protein